MNLNSSESEMTAALETRREALQKMGATVLFFMAAGGLQGQGNPTAARARRDPFIKLNLLEGKTLEALGDTLLPGAEKAGIAYYVDHQLASDTPLLMLKYLDYPETFLDFYRKGLASLEALARTRHNRSFADLTPQQQTALVREISQSNPAGWNGPPAPLFYFATRNDAMDVFYGSQEGFGRLGIPYMPHIPPQQKW